MLIFGGALCLTDVYDVEVLARVRRLSDEVHLKVTVVRATPH